MTRLQSLFWMVIISCNGDLYPYLCVSGVLVGLDQTYYRVSEDVGVVKLCANVSFWQSMSLRFNVTISTSSGSAGND